MKRNVIDFLPRLNGCVVYIDYLISEIYSNLVVKMFTIILPFQEINVFMFFISSEQEHGIAPGHYN